MKGNQQLDVAARKSLLFKHCLFTVNLVLSILQKRTLSLQAVQEHTISLCMSKSFSLIYCNSTTRVNHVKEIETVIDSRSCFCCCCSAQSTVIFGRRENTYKYLFALLTSSLPFMLFLSSTKWTFTPISIEILFFR